MADCYQESCRWRIKDCSSPQSCQCVACPNRCDGSTCYATDNAEGYRLEKEGEENGPLTPEQLREMDGEPVWIVDVGPHKWYGPGWAIVDRDNCLVRTVKNWNAVFFESYGERWLAYRRPPEGEEDT